MCGQEFNNVYFVNYKNSPFLSYLKLFKNVYLYIERPFF